MALHKVNLTIDGTNNYVTIDYLATDNTTIVGTDYLSFYNLRDEKDGWWFNRDFETEHSRKLFFSQILNLNGSAIGVTTQAQVTALLVAAIAV